MDPIESIYKEPEKWKVGRHTLIHENGAGVWISGAPVINTNMYPGISMSIFRKYRLWRAVRWWCNNASIEDLRSGR